MTDLFKMLLSKSKVIKEIASQVINDGEVKIHINCKFIYCWGEKIMFFDKSINKKERRMIYDFLKENNIVFSIKKEEKIKDGSTIHKLSPTKLISYYLIINNQEH